MEFLDREQMHRRPGGVEIRLNKKFNHEDMVRVLSQPWRFWDREEIVLDRESKNRVGHGRLKMGLSEASFFLKEFLPKSRVDTLVSLRRPSRAERSFHAGLEMRLRGLPTPEPFAALTVRRAGWVRGHWLLTELLPPMPSVRELGDHPDRHEDVLSIWPWESVLCALGRLLRRMSDAHVCHRDLSLRNILVEKPGENPPEEPRLWVIDLHRALTLDAARWRLSDGATNFKRLRLSPEDFQRVLRAHFPDEAEFEAHRASFERARERHRTYKRLKKLPRRWT
jgi:hypothetical protein